MRSVSIRRRSSRRFGRPRGWRRHVGDGRPTGPWSPHQAVYFSLLKTFARAKKHARVPYAHREGNFPLGAWVCRQRLAFRRGELSAEQIRLFEALPDWVWSPLDESFRKGLSSLKAFQRREGHTAVRYAHREDGFRLGAWVRIRRRDYARGRLDPGRVRLLEAVPGWFWRRRDPFDVNFERLRRFYEREGHARIPSKHLEDGYHLGRWVERMRRAQREGWLPRGRARLLERLPGWTSDPKGDWFERGHRVLKIFLRREGHSRVPTDHVEAGVLLGVWVSNRRADYRRGRLSPREIRGLEKLRGWTWDARSDSFEKGFAFLLRFAKREGHACVPVHHAERGFRLGAWVHKRRQERHRMSDERRRRLQALPGWVWDKHDAQFRAALRLLLSFAKRQGHARVPARHVEAGFPLGGWVSHVRQRKQSLSAERRRALGAVPGWVWSCARR